MKCDKCRHQTYSALDCDAHCAKEHWNGILMTMPCDESMWDDCKDFEELTFNVEE